VLRKKEKAQGLVEFALILPFLLLALLAVVEAARIIWAYTTVQTAAREAARYAITGKPYVTSGYVPAPGQPNVCTKPEGEPGATVPWNCDPSLRVEAIKEMARTRINTMALNTACSATEIINSAPCTQKPGNYGILVVGQMISATSSITTPIEVVDYPGTQGLNVQVSIFYNVEMFDPLLDAISDAIMGRPDSYIQVRGELTMQNEGIDPSLGNAPPPAIGSSSLFTNTGSTGIGPNGEQIWSESGYSVMQNDYLSVHLQNHQNQGGPYDIYLDSYQICAAVNTDTQNNTTVDCLIDSTIPAGQYDLFSTRAGQYPNRLATAPQKVTVGASTLASIKIVNGNIWAAKSFIQIQLENHNPAKQPFNIYFNYGLASQQTIATGVNATGPVPLWQVPDVGNLCPAGGTPCTIESRSSSDGFATTYASTDIFVNPPKIKIAGNDTQFTQGDTLYISLESHTPGQQYDIRISDGGANTYYIGRTAQPTNPLGNTSGPILWTVFEPGAPGWPSGWPNGTYNITSHPISNPPSMTPANQIASQQIQINTPNGPFITVDGGYTWPMNSIITIKVHNHPLAGNPYFLNFGSVRVPVNGANPANTFTVGSSLSAAQNYTIPPTAVTNGQPTVHTISSYRNSNPPPAAAVAQRNVTVTPVPIITISEGARALPDATITINLTNHTPNSTYQIAYAGVTLLEASGQPFTIQTDSTGKGQRKYNLLTLPTASPAANPLNYGVTYILNSQPAAAPATIVATTTLIIDVADLKITQIQLPPSAAINTAIPMVVTIQNTKPVTIARYFDVDLYADPSPLVPAFKPNTFNFPGDVKLWKAPIVAPFGQSGDTFSMTQPFTLTTYGKHVFYSYADTSNFIFNENSEVNNILSNTITINCNYPFITENFANLNAWDSAIYNTTNTQNESGYPRTTGGHLVMSNDGRGTTGSNDNVSSKGHVFLYRSQSITTEVGLDVRVQVFDAPDTADFAKAGLQLRANPGSGTSPKIEFDLAWDSSNNRYFIQHNYRSANGTLGGNTPGSGTINLNTNPVWLRITRDPASDIFTFYYAQQSAAPTNAQWIVFDTVAIPIDPTLYVGLFNSSALNNTNGRAEFDNFSVSDTSVCPLADGPVDPPTPPGLTICSDPLQNKSFETVSNWVLAGGEFVSYGPGGHTGSRQLLAHSFNGNYRKPWFYQQFTMPASLLATTTLKLDFFYTLNNMGDGDDAADKYFAVVGTAPSSSEGLLTTPVEILNGDVPPDSAAAPPNTTTSWTQRTLSLPLASGVNLQSYAGQNLYLYIYNNSNIPTVSCPLPGCHASEFYFDDVNLSVCTGEPEPDTASTKLTGDVWLHQTGSTPQRIAGVNVWAYAENGTLYKTFTIQNGKFNYFNLPATPAGTRYFLYAEYFIVDPNDANQIQQLAANTTVLLKTSHTNQSPLITRLDLFPTN
jgi:hypothetical protein